MDPYLGMIFLFGGNFAINGFYLCQGQLLSISSNADLFAILGTTFGGNGTSTFALPDLQGRTAVGQGSGVGLSTYVIGQKGGTENASILLSNLPVHTHTVSALSVTIKASSAAATANTPVVGTSTIAAPYDPYSGDFVNGFNGSAPNIALNTLGTTASGTTGSTGSAVPLSILQPFLVLNYQIAYTGIFPSRN